MPNEAQTDFETTASSEKEAQLLRSLYADFESASLTPLWTQREGLMPMRPEPAAVPAVWRWSTLYPLAQRAGELVPVGRGGERRAIALRNPAIPDEPYATPTLWAAIQYLGPWEEAPSHRHTQTAFRFVIEGEGVWTNVEGDAIAMCRGDLLLTPSWHFHEHHNSTGQPMAWIDGLDIPLVKQLDAGFFEFGPDEMSTHATPARSRNEMLWGHPGLTPIGARAETRSTLAAYRWIHTDRALSEQLELELAGHPVTVEPGHAAVRYTDPASGADALRTIRTEFHRLRAGTVTRTSRTVGSSVWQVFDGEGTVTLGDRREVVTRGDLFAVPSWVPFTIEATSSFDAFRFSDEPVYEALGLARTDLQPRT
ncbi:cupin domain-containing protein [Streptomyces sp. NPDC096311]|uniref:cupin domain-containing protein n=1 Tax=Streptomyces sp. NPDC096311 TaxID=3366083 RepID=UPI0038100F71